MEPIVIDDFIPEVYQDSIYHLMTGREFPWSFYDYSVSDEPLENFYQIGEPYQEHVQMGHLFVRDNEIKSEYFKYIAPLLGSFVKETGTNLGDMFRIKSNLLVAQPGTQTQFPHADGMNVVDGQITSIDKKTLLYYVNDSDGSTRLFDNTGNVVQEIEPKKGRFFLFPNELHAAAFPW